MNPILLQLYNGELHPRAEAEQPRVDMFTHRREYFCKHLTDKAPELETKLWMTCFWIIPPALKKPFSRDSLWPSG